jgi:hypothetical protein
VKSLLAVWSLCLVLGVYLSSVAGDMARSVTDEARGIQSDCGAIGEVINDQRERISRIDNRTTTGSTTVSYYSDWFEGRKTATGEVFRQDKRIIASNQYPFGTILILTAGYPNALMGVSDLERHRPATTYGNGSLIGKALGCEPKGCEFKSHPLHQSWGIVCDRIAPKFGHRTDVSKLIFEELGTLEKGILNCDVLVIGKEK